MQRERAITEPFPRAKCLHKLSHERSPRKYPRQTKGGSERLNNFLRLHTGELGSCQLRFTPRTPSSSSGPSLCLKLREAEQFAGCHKTMGMHPVDSGFPSLWRSSSLCWGALIHTHQGQVCATTRQAPGLSSSPAMGSLAKRGWACLHCISQEEYSEMSFLVTPANWCKQERIHGKKSRMQSVPQMWA